MVSLVVSAFLVCVVPFIEHHRERVREEILERIADGQITRVAIRRNQHVNPTRILEGDRVQFFGKRYHIDATITNAIDCGDDPEVAEWLIEFRLDP